MSPALLFAVYLMSVSLGLPDTLLGAAWPAMRVSLGAPLDSAGAVSLVVSLCTVCSSLLSARLLRRLGTGRVALFSVLMTSIALFGFSAAPSLFWLLLPAVPLGLGAGAVDAGLNDFVARHGKPRHMAFFHCFWGVGAMSGPVATSLFLSHGGQWRTGYRLAASFLLCATLIILLLLPLWKRAERFPDPKTGMPPPKPIGNFEALKLPGVKLTLLSFLCYCSLENSAGLWASSYLTECRALPPGEAALCTSLFYGGIAAGRFCSGLLSDRCPAGRLIRFGQLLCAAGAALLLLPLPLPVTISGLLLFGLGCAPLYPAMLQETPARCACDASQTVMGLQIAVAYTGSTVVPPLLGVAARHSSIAILPWFLLLSVIAMWLSRKRGENRLLNS